MRIYLQNISIGVVGKGEEFTILSDDENHLYVSAMERRVTSASSAAAASGEPAAAAGTDADAPAASGDDMETH